MPQNSIKDSDKDQETATYGRYVSGAAPAINMQGDLAKYYQRKVQEGKNKCQYSMLSETN